MLANCLSSVVNMQIFGCVLETSGDNKRGLPVTSIECAKPLHVAGIKRPTKRTEKGKVSLFSSYISILDECKFPQHAFFLLSLFCDF